MSIFSRIGKLSQATKNAWVIFGLALVIPVGWCFLWALQVIMPVDAWLFVIASIPAALVLNQGNRVMVTEEPKTGNPLSLNSTNVKSSLVRDEFMNYYGAKSLWINYGLPYLLTLIGGWILAYVLSCPTSVVERLPDSVLRGGVLGGLGAYVQVVMSLSMRSFRRDVTPGASVWSAVNLVIGPILGGVTSVILESTVRIDDFTRDVFYFFAGLAPRQMVALVDGVVRRFWDVRQGVTEEVRLLPLRHVRGITPEIEDRLEEEGITDAYMLSMANPLHLNRNLPYDERQIYCWIDEALLMMFFPEHYRQMQNRGLTGAMDVAYLWWLATPYEGDDDDEVDENAVAALKNLGKEINIDEVVLRSIGRRMCEDAQVSLVWMLYQDGEGV